MLLPPAFFVSWRVLSSCFDVAISENAATVFFMLWTLQSDMVVSEDGLLDRTNSHLEKYGRVPLTKAQLAYELSLLERIRAIKKKHGNPVRWALLEKIRIVYQ